MPKKALAAPTFDGFKLDPEQIVLVVDPKHPLYSKSVHDPLDEALCRNIAKFGVLEPVIVRKDGDQVLCVDGRHRVAAAREANKRLREGGGEPWLIPAIVKRGEDVDMSAFMVMANGFRHQDSPVELARKANRLVEGGKSLAEVATIFGHESERTIKDLLRLLDLDPKVLKAVEAGKVAPTAAIKLDKLPRDEQRKQLAALEKGGEKVTAKTVAAKVKEAQGEAPGPTPPGRRLTAAVLGLALAEAKASPQLGAEGSLAGFINGLKWVLTGETNPAIAKLVQAAQEKKAEVANG